MKMFMTVSAHVIFTV